MPTTQRVNASEVAQYLPAGYRRRTAYLGTRHPGPVSVKSYWDGGSKDEFLLIRGGRQSNVGSDPHGKSGDHTIELQAGDVFVRHGTFCGKPAHASIEKVVAPPPDQVLTA